MIDQLTAIDTDLFLTLNGIHNTYWDYFMSAFSTDEHSEEMRAGFP